MDQEIRDMFIRFAQAIDAAAEAKETVRLIQDEVLRVCEPGKYIIDDIVFTVTPQMPSSCRYPRGRVASIQVEACRGSWRGN